MKDLATPPPPQLPLKYALYNSKCRKNKRDISIYIFIFIRTERQCGEKNERSSKPWSAVITGSTADLAFVMGFMLCCVVYALCVCNLYFPFLLGFKGKYFNGLKKQKDDDDDDVRDIWI